MSAPDRRKRRRTGCQIPSELECRFGVLIGTMLDSSNGGAFFVPDTVVDLNLFYPLDGFIPAKEREKVKIRFHPADGPSIILPAVVRWKGDSEEHQARGLGLEFTGGTPPWPRS